MKRVAVVYTHFPHYRAPVFSALSHSVNYEFIFYYDPRGIDSSIANGSSSSDHKILTVLKLGKFMWQFGAISIAARRDVDALIFLGNPLIISTWLAALGALLHGKPVFFWTHGWLQKDPILKACVRRFFYRLADGLLVYGTRARELGQSQGFNASRIFVINNSLDYSLQKMTRDLLEDSSNARDELCCKPYFLCVSRLVDSVELNLAIEAMSFMPSELSLIVIGEGPKREELQEQALAYGVDVKFAGAIYDENELAKFFLGAQAVVSPGKIGLLALHALGYGTPVITHSDFDRQMPEVEVIEVGVTGVFFRYGDARDLAEKMKTLLGWSDEDRQKCRSASLKRIEENYTPEVQVKLIEEALSSFF